MQRILFVEDDPEIGQLISSWLGRHDMDVILEPRGDMALARVEAEQPDLVLLDVMLPGQDAWAVRLQALGQDHCNIKGCKTPVCLQNTIALWSGDSPTSFNYPDQCPLRAKESCAEIMEARPAQFEEFL